MHHHDPLILPRGVVFDMDGTLTQPMLDFPRIKQEMGIGKQPILEALAKMTPEERFRAEAVLHRHEEHAAEQSTLNPGCRELLAWLHEREIVVALVTRNSLKSVRTVLKRHDLKIEVLITREDGKHKPHPDPLLTACRKLHVSPHEAWMIGDGQYDIEAAQAAEMRSVWISHGTTRPFAAEPWKTVRNLLELQGLLERGTHQIT